MADRAQGVMLRGWRGAASGALVFAAVAAAALAGPSDAAALPCDPVLEDSGGFDWDLQSSGAVGDGEDDAFDGHWNVEVTVAPDPATGYFAEDDTCSAEESQREVVYPERADTGGADDFGGLLVSRKVYVPAGGTPFGRWLTVLRNPTATPITAGLAFFANYGHSMSSFAATSSGDQTLAAGDVWATAVSNNPPETPENDDATSSLFDAAAGAADLFDSADPLITTLTAGFVNYQNVTVPAGGTVALMQFFAQRETAAESLAIAESGQFGTEEMYAGLSDAERAALINWPSSPPASPAPPAPPSDGGGQDSVAPETTITDGPKKVKRRRGARKTATFKFDSSEPGSSFECKLDDEAFESCVPPRTYKKLRIGRHSFEVRAIDAAGNADPSPTEFSWKVGRKKK